MAEHSPRPNPWPAGTCAYEWHEAREAWRVLLLTMCDELGIPRLMRCLDKLCRRG